MLLELCSTAAFAPPPPIALFEPSDRVPPRHVGARSRLVVSSTSSTSSISVPAETVSAVSGPLAQVGVELEKRIQTLRIEAELDQVAFSDASLRDFRTFMANAQPQRRPSLFLSDSGNLRAVWRTPDRQQVALQFLGNGTMQFVIFRRRPGMPDMSRVAGVDAKANIMAQIKANHALDLLRA